MHGKGTVKIVIDIVGADVQISNLCADKHMSRVGHET